MRSHVVGVRQMGVRHLAVGRLVGVVPVPLAGRRDSPAEGDSLNRNLIHNYQTPHYLDTVASTAGDSAGSAGSRDGAGTSGTEGDHRTSPVEVHNQAVDIQGVTDNHLNDL